MFTQLIATWLRIASVLAILLVSMTVHSANTEEKSSEAGQPIFELRTYTTNAGKLPALEARFRDHTMSLFEKHGFKNIGYWIPVDKPNTLIYIIAHPNRDAIATGWKAFGSDPAWQKVAKESQLDGPILIKGGITSQFMTASDFSPIQ
jgi:hypothetical protein